MNEIDTADFRRQGVLQEFGYFIGRLTRVADGLVIVVALLLFYDSRTWLATDQRLAECVLALLISQAAAGAFRFSRSWRIIRIRQEMIEIALFSLLSFGAIGLLFWAMGFLPLAEAAAWLPALGTWYVATLVGSMGLRVLIRMSLRYFRAYGFDQRAAAFVGATPTAVRLAQTFEAHRWMGIRVVGFFDDRIAADRPGAAGVPAISGTVSDLVALARSGGVSKIYITLPMAAESRVRSIVEQFQDSTASIYYSPSMADFSMIGARWDEVYGQPVISIVETPFHGASRAFKLVEDWLLMLLVVPLVIPVMLIVAPLIKLTSPGPVFYVQRRFGLDGKPFLMFKFRTMYVSEGDAAFVQARRGDARITPLGRFLRRTSIDELPQLLNVLNGTMSMVGPRPHPIKLNEDYRQVIHRYMIRHKIKPGITGLAQINGARGETDTLDKMELRLKYDLDYIRSWSLALDLKIIARTVLLPVTDTAAY